MSAYIYINYPRKEGVWFDMDYYIKTHMSIVDKHWRPLGMKSWSIVQMDEDDKSGIHVQAIMLWESREAFEKAIEANIPEVMQDWTHYTNELPWRFFAKVVKTSGEGI